MTRPNPEHEWLGRDFDRPSAPPWNRGCSKVLFLVPGVLLLLLLLTFLCRPTSSEALAVPYPPQKVTPSVPRWVVAYVRFPDARLRVIDCLAPVG